MVELINELRQMHSRQDLLLAEHDHFQETIRALQSDVELHKRRYETAKTELRDLKRKLSNLINLECAKEIRG